MFLVFWEPAAFNRMQQFIRDHPELKAALRYTLQTLAGELGLNADTWGESRGGDLRLGYEGVLWVLVRVDPGGGTTRVIDVRLQQRPKPH